MKTLRWIGFNTLYVALMVAGLGFDIKGAANVLLVLTWFMICLSPFLLTGDVIKHIEENGLSVPNWVDLSLDIGIFTALVWYGWMWTGAFYVLHIMFAQSAKYQAGLTFIKKDEE